MVFRYLRLSALTDAFISDFLVSAYATSVIPTSYNCPKGKTDVK